MILHDHVRTRRQNTGVSVTSAPEWPALSSIATLDGTRRSTASSRKYKDILQFKILELEFTINFYVLICSEGQAHLGLRALKPCSIKSKNIIELSEKHAENTVRDI
jgi:hypothetical protein